MEDRRRARIGTVSGLALLTGATALVAVGGGHHSVFATLLLGLLAAVMAHALVIEIQRQARRRSQVVWVRHDTVNTVLLSSWSLGATALVPFASRPVQLLGLLLAVGYAAACAYFVVERRRAVSAPVLPAPSPPAESPTPRPVVPDSASAT
ncbi:hypothetical protein [Actinoplanes sp. GCM10030250]|uniref:hypothetical protein n=1 Tax=Actinoplanes sp. GCM10030250 TaxID=3273376 RepID=UPI0036066C21